MAAREGGLGLPGTDARRREGLDVVRKLEAVPANFSSKDNGFLKAGLAIGDGRATFAKTRIGRPLARVQVLKSGLVAAPKPAEETAELVPIVRKSVVL